MLAVMMSLAVLHAGDGYAYLTRSVATGDRNRGPMSLTDYYSATGTPPGRWAGRGLNDLADGPAEVAGQSVVAGEVTAVQMANLFGAGLHPNAEQIETVVTAGAVRPREKQRARVAVERAVKLGRKFPTFTNEVPLLVAVDAAATVWEKTNGMPATAEVRARLTREIAPQVFAEEKGQAHQNPRELTAWVAAQKRRQRQPVAGYDLTFTPQKSVSVLWALADKTTAEKIVDIHHRAIADTLGWLEREAAFTRADSGRVQLDVGGLIIAQFDHWDTRSGDPNLHTHCAVSNKVRRHDGTWGSLDGASIFRHTVAASERYNASMIAMLTDELGIEFTPRETGVNAQPVMEIGGISDELIGLFSRRRGAITPRRDELVAAYRAKHGYSPSKETEYALLQQATLETRAGKQSPVSLDQIRAGARARAAAVVPAERLNNFVRIIQAHAATDPGVPVPDYVAMHMGDEVPVVVAGRRPAFPGTEAAAKLAVSLVSERRATWTHAHIRARAEAISTYFHFATPEDRRAAVEATVHAALTKSSVSLATFARGEHGIDLAAEAAVPAALQRRDGQSVFTRHGEQLYTSAAILAAEKTLSDAAADPTPHFAYTSTLRKIVGEMKTDTGRALNSGQGELLRHFCQSGTRLAVATGPAGTGKTTAMSAVVKVWQAHGREVIALAPSAAAATILGEEIGVQGRTLASLTYSWRGLHTHRGIPAKTLPVGVEIGRGTMLLVDEAAMASTKDLAALQELADHAGAIVRLIGDPAQLDAVETGGALRMLADATHAPELTDVVRFGADTEQARNSLRLRAGNIDGLGMFAKRGWLHAGTSIELAEQVFTAFTADTMAGRESVMLASTNTEIFELNARAQAWQQDRGTVDADADGPAAALADGHTARVGDRIVTRANNRDLRTTASTRPGTAVLNGDLWSVQQVHDNGAISVRHDDHGGTVTLPAHYVKASVQLGYASTIHRAQGMTVDTCHALIGTVTDRAGAYVALTRGRYENHAYVADSIDLDPDIEAHQLASQPEQVDAITRMGTVLARDGHMVAATTAMRTALEQATSGEAKGDAYRYGQSLLRDGWIEHLIAETLEPADAARVRVHPESHAALVAALGRVHDAGYKARAVLERIAGQGPLGSAEDVAAVLGARLGEHSRKESRLVPALPPVYPGVDRGLMDWARRLRPQALAAARTAAAGTSTGAAAEKSRPVSVLPNNPWARMSDTALAKRERAVRTDPAMPAMLLHMARQERAQLAANSHLSRARTDRAAAQLAERIRQAREIDRQIGQARSQRDRLIRETPKRRFRAAKIDPQVPVLEQRIAELEGYRQMAAAQLPAESEWRQAEAMAPRGIIDDDQIAAGKDAAALGRIDTQIATYTGQLEKQQATLTQIHAEMTRREGLPAAQRAAENAERAQHTPPPRTQRTASTPVPQLPPEPESTRDTGYGL